MKATTYSPINRYWTRGKQVLDQLSAQKFRGCRNRFGVEHRFGLNVLTLSSEDLGKEQIAKFFLFLKEISSYIEMNFQTDPAKKFPLTMPRLDHLKIIDFDIFLNNPKAMRVVYINCLHATNGTMAVDLSFLHDIYLHFSSSVLSSKVDRD